MSRYLIAATGLHNRAVIPQIDRHSSAVHEYHACEFINPAELAGRRVLVVGGGASAYDLLDLCFEHGASHVVWVYRGLRWMSPTSKPKHAYGGPRDLGRLQMQGLSRVALNDITNETLRRRYQKLGLLDILPDRPFDFARDQMIPGRYRMIAGFAEIERHQGEVDRIEDQSVRLSDGSVVQADLLLWGTGYEVDTGYFESTSLSSTRSRAALARRCGSMFLSLDAPNLFFLAPGLLETTGTLPLAYCYVCRSIMAHIQGKARFGERQIEGNRNHLELLDVLADVDPHHFPAGQWKSALHKLVSEIPDGKAMPIP